MSGERANLRVLLLLLLEALADLLLEDCHHVPVALQRLVMLRPYGLTLLHFLLQLCYILLDFKYFLFLLLDLLFPFFQLLLDVADVLFMLCLGLFHRVYKCLLLFDLLLLLFIEFLLLVILFFL